MQCVIVYLALDHPHQLLLVEELCEILRDSVIVLQFLRDDNVDDVADLRLHSLVLSVHEFLDALHLLVQLFL